MKHKLVSTGLLFSSLLAVSSPVLATSATSPNTVETAETSDLVKKDAASETTAPKEDKTVDSKKDKSTDDKKEAKTTEKTEAKESDKKENSLSVRLLSVDGLGNHIKPLKMISVDKKALKEAFASKDGFEKWVLSLNEDASIKDYVLISELFDNDTLDAIADDKLADLKEGTLMFSYREGAHLFRYHDQNGKYIEPAEIVVKEGESLNDKQLELDGYKFKSKVTDDALNRTTFTYEKVESVPQEEKTDKVEAPAETKEDAKKPTEERDPSKATTTIIGNRDTSTAGNDVVDKTDSKATVDINRQTAPKTETKSDVKTENKDKVVYGSTKEMTTSDGVLKDVQFSRSQSELRVKGLVDSKVWAQEGFGSKFAIITLKNSKDETLGVYRVDESGKFDSAISGTIADGEKVKLVYAGNTYEFNFDIDENSANSVRIDSTKSTQLGQTTIGSKDKADREALASTSGKNLPATGDSVNVMTALGAVLVASVLGVVAYQKGLFKRFMKK